MPTLSQTATRAYTELTLAARWWLAELKHALPWWERLLHDGQASALLYEADGQTRLLLLEADAPAPREEVFAAPLEQLSAEQGARLAGLCAQHELAIALPDQAVLRLPLALPAGTRGAARQAIAYRLLTESPLRADSMLFDVQAAGADSTLAQVALCRSATVAALQARAQQLGLSSPSIGWRAPGQMALAFCFVRGRGVRSAAERARRNGWLALAPLLLLALGLLGAWGYAGWQERSLQRQVDALSAQSDASLRLLARQARTRALTAAMAADLPPGSLTQVLNDVSLRLPRSAWLTELRVEAGRLRLVGNGAEPTAVARALAATPQLAGVRLDTLTSGTTASGPAHFEITAELVLGRSK
ncbi:MAG: PilN domain-containing protein [Pseudomonadota bacterium]